MKKKVDKTLSYDFKYSENIGKSMAVYFQIVFISNNVITSVNV